MKFSPCLGTPVQNSAFVMVLLASATLPLAYLAFRLMRREEKQYINKSGCATWH